MSTRLIARTLMILSLVVASGAGAQTFPDKPIRIIVPFGAGSAVDTIARAVGAQVAEQVGQSLVIDNRTGANGIIAAEAAARSAPDGYTLFMPNDGIMAANPAMHAKLPYDPLKDFAPVTLFSTVPLVLVAHPAFPAKNLAELLSLAKARPNSINFSSTGAGAAQHLAMEFLMEASGTRMTHVPHKAMGPALADVLAGHIPLMFSGMSNVVALVKEGKLRALAVSTARRSSAMPEVPSAAEAGVPGYSYAAWNGVVAPAATPPDVVRRLHAEFAKAIANPAVRAKLSSLGFELSGEGPAEFGALIRADVARYGKLIRAIGITAN
ncbi:MAG: tripartite tricarboxylate transporter substrate binding protein [Burkholderiales bacterium]|nr:tripartite tricarboxylate transporter substrate binding protein [Burkholderiales bacterium]